ncbi:hypothetical protein [Butyrivibrio sp. AC2005]|uniref:hypothetical protein n=1 Tax=Butyrivibrio sp. AC2005 TaxID=1280672 RepID=UPI0005D23782|nr:hypothetical protein [Butyrivibrio sp. AC2005]
MEEITLRKKESFMSGVLGFIIPTVILVAVVVFFFIGVTQISDSTLDKQEDSLYTAIERDIVQCYSLEGIYPPSLEYLEEHYALVYNKDLFFVDYRPIASNIYPDVTIIRKGKKFIGVNP